VEGIRNAPPRRPKQQPRRLANLRKSFTRVRHSQLLSAVWVELLDHDRGPWGVFLALAPLWVEFIPETFQNDS
jgi:hypothetical protein